VMNIAGIARSTRLTNVFDVLINGELADRVDSETISNTVIIAEPRLSATKSVATVSPIDAGDLVTFTVVVSNDNTVDSAPAFDVLITDTLDSRYVLQSASVAASTIATPFNPAGSTAVVTAGNQISVTRAQLDPAGLVTVTIVARVAPTATLGDSLPNSMRAIYSSIPVVTGTVGNPLGVNITGTAGSLYGERDGSGGLNSYMATATSAPFTLATPTFAKLPPPVSTATIGDPITYTLAVTLPEGTARSVRVLDDLPTGLTYVSSSISTTQYAGSVPAPVITQPGGDVLFDFGDITTTDNNTPADNRFDIIVVARVTDIAANINGAALGNTARMTYTHALNGDSVLNGGAQTITVVEPRLIASKSINASGPFQSGSLITYVVRITNTGTSTAYDSTLTDTLPTGVSAPLLTSASINGVTVAASSSGSAPNITLGEWDIPVNGVLIVTYTVQATDALGVNGAFTNTADADWRSRDNADVNGRVYADTGNSPFDTTGDTTRAQFSTGVVSFSKSDNGVTSAPIGAIVRYTLTVNSPLGTVRDLRITDTLPANLSFVGPASIGPNITPQPVATLSGQDVIWSFGNVVITQSNSVTVAFDVRIDNVAANTTGLVKTNVATMTYQTITGTAISLSSSDSLTLIEPGTGLSKRVTPSRTPTGAGDLVTYTLTLTNTGNAPAFDLQLTDTLPAGLSFVSTVGNIVSNPAGSATDSNVSGATALTYTVSQLNAGGTVVVTLTARVANTIGAAQTLTNTAQATLSSVPGTPVNDRVYTSTLASAAIATGLPALTLSKAVTPLTPLAPGKRFTYTLVVSNTGVVTATGVSVTDPVPANTTLISTDPAAAGAPSTASWTIGTLGVGQTRTLTMVVEINAGTAHNTSITNTASVTSAEGIGAIAQVQSLVQHAELAINKSIEPRRPIVAGETLTFTIDYVNNGTVPAENVSITDTLPLPFVWNGQAISTPLVQQQPGTVPAWYLPVLAPGASGSIVITVVSSSATRLDAILTNTVAISSSTPDYDLNNNVAAAGSPSLRVDIQKNVNPAVVNIGELVTYTLVLTNGGGFTLTAVPLGDTFDPTRLSFVSASLSPSSTTPGQLVWNNTGALSVDQVRAITVTFRALTSTTGLQTVNTITAAGEYSGVVTPLGYDTAQTQITAPALAIDKTSSTNGAPVAPGSLLTYTIRVTNTGDGVATNVTVRDTLPAQAVFVSATPAPVSGMTWVFPTLAAGASTEITLTTRITLPLPSGTTIGNTVSVTATQNVPGANASVTDSVVSTRTLEINKTGPAVTTPAGTIVWTIAYTATGDAPAEGVSISDTLPVRSTFVSTSAPSHSLTGNLLTIPLGTLNPSASGVTQTTGLITVTALADSIMLSGTLLVNTASISDVVLPPVASTVTTTVSATHALALSKHSASATVVPGGLITWTLNYTITGNEPTLSVLLVDTLPAATTLVSTDTPGYTLQGNTIQFALGTITPTTSGAITVIAQMTSTPTLSGTRVVNTASISDTQGLSATANATVSVISSHALALSKDAPVIVAPGGLITYTLSYTVTGDEPAREVTLSDVLPPATTFVSTSAASYSLTGQNLQIDLGTLTPTVSGLVSVTVRMTDTPTLSGTLLVNTASIDDLDELNATASATTSVVSSHALALSKSAPVTATPNGLITYTLAYTVTGDEPALGVTLVDTLPAQTTFVSSSQPAAVSVPNLQFALGTLTPTTRGLVTVTARADTPLLSGTLLVNTASITDTQSQRADANATSSIVSAHALSISKQVDNLTGAPGDTLVYTLIYTVTGDEPAFGIMLQDVLPAGVAFVATDAIAATVATPTLSLNIGAVNPTLAAPVSGQVVITVTVDGTPVANGTVLTNSATITDQAGLNASAVASTTLLTDHALLIDKTVIPASVAPGDLVTYTIFYTATGNEPAPGVLITDTLPTGLSFVSTTAATHTVLGSEVRFNLGTLVPPTSGSFQIVAQVSSVPALSGTALLNTIAIGDAEGVNDTGAAQNAIVSSHALTLDKTAPATVSPNGLITYTLTYSVTGNEPALGVLLSDTLPAQVTLVSTSQPASVTGQNIQFALGTLTPTVSGVVTVVVRASTPLISGTLLVNNAGIIDTQGVRASASASTRIVSSNTLAIDKRVQPATAAPGEVVTYTVAYTVTGDAPAFGVTVSDTLPADLTLLSTSASVVTLSPTQLRLDVGTVSPTLSAPVTGLITYTARLTNTPRLNGTVLPNVARISDTAGRVTQSVAPVTVNAAHVFALRKTADRAVVLAGTQITYTLAYTLTGNEPALNVLLTDTLPAGMTLVSISAPGATTLGASADFGTLTPTTTGLVTVVATVASSVTTGTQLLNAARIGDAQGVFADASVNTPVIAEADLAVRKTIAPDPVIAGQLVRYTLVYSNSGPSDAVNVGITDTLPAGLSFVSASVTPNIAGQTASWSLGTLPSGASGTLVVTATVNPGAALALTNTASIASTTTDPNLSNNASAAPVRVEYADVYALKSVEPTTPVRPGDMVTWTIRYGNAGITRATDVVLRDVLPSGVTWNGAYTVSTAAGFTNTAPALAWSLGTLQPGTSGELVFTATANIGTSNDVRFVNIVSVTTSTPQTDTLDDVSSVSTPKIDLLVSKTVSRNPVIVGEAFSYTLRVTNTGGITLTSLPLTDTYDATYLSYTGASPAPVASSTGQLLWNLAPLSEGASVEIVANFMALTTTRGVETFNTITATGANGAVVLPDVRATTVVRVLAPALGISKQRSAPNGVRPGQAISYTLVVTNSGDTAATSVTLTDVWTIDGVPQPTALSVTPFTLAVNSAVTFTYAITLPTPITDGVMLSNTASVSSFETPAPATASISDTIVAGAEITLSKTQVPGVIIPNELITYTLAYTVTGYRPVLGLVLTDRVPLHTAFVDAQPSGVVSVTGDLVRWNLGDPLTYASGINTHTGVVTLTVRATTPLTNGLVIRNSATLFERQGLTVTTTASGTVQSSSALALEKFVAQRVPVPGQLLTYTLIYTYSGDAPARNVLLRDTLPAGTTYVEAQPAPQFAGGTPPELRWSLGDLLTPQSGIITLTVRVEDALPGTLITVTNIATLTADGGLGATATRSIPLPADVSVSKTAGAELTRSGDALVYTVTVRNNGTANTRNVLITDTLGAGMAFSTTPTCDACASTISADGKTLQIELSTLNAGQITQLVYSVRVNDLYSGTLSNTVRISSPAPDLVPENDQATVTTRARAPVLAISKVVSPDEGIVVRPGFPLTYTIYVTNTGDVAADKVVVTDTIPPDTVYVTGSARPLVSPLNNELRWVLGTLQPGQSAMMRFEVTVVNNAVNTAILNTAWVSADQVSGSIGSNTVANPFGPSAIVLQRFTAVRGVTGVDVRFETLFETSSQSFYILRAESPDRATAVRVSPELAPKGPGGGSYSWLDTGAPDVARLYYWIEEIETSGQLLYYGPAVTGSAATRLYLPLVAATR
jgi:uncharacterized repeat protein (TIGR01451 family)/fimbrial isopeptide formation D2 family protein